MYSFVKVEKCQGKELAAGTLFNILFLCISMSHLTFTPEVRLQRYHTSTNSPAHQERGGKKFQVDVVDRGRLFSVDIIGGCGREDICAAGATDQLH